MSKLLLVTALLLVSSMLHAQNWNADLALLRGDASGGVPDAYYQRPGNNGNVIDTKGKDVVSKYNPLTLLLKGTMFTYQHVISPQLSRHCPYEITCSNFSKQSIQEFGIVKGVFLSADRILRCNRIGILDTDVLDFNDKDGTIKDAPNKYR